MRHLAYSRLEKARLADIAGAGDDHVARSRRTLGIRVSRERRRMSAAHHLPRCFLS